MDRRSEKLPISENPSFSENYFDNFMVDNTVIAENFPADYLLENLEKLFCSFGRVKSFRVTNPRDPNLAGCSRDVLIIKEGWWGFERTLSGLHAIVEYQTVHEANEAIRHFHPYGRVVYQKNGFRVRSRRDYSIATEKDTTARRDRDSDVRDEMRNPKMGRGSLTEKPPCVKPLKNHEALAPSIWEKRAGFRY